MTKMTKQTVGVPICNTRESTRLLLSRSRAMASVALIALCVMLAPNAKAQCGSTALAWKAAALPTVFWPEEALSFPVESARQQPSEASTEDGQEASLIGLWRIKFISGGLVIDDGWDTWHSDGTEVLIDVPFGSACPGVWERAGRLTYTLNHPAFNFDPSGSTVVSIFVYRGHVNLDPGGNSFTGTFTWDSYDFSGKFIAGSHVQGTLSGRRVTLNSIPFF